MSASVADDTLTLLWCGIGQLGTGDVTGVNIIAFRRFSQMDISGNVVINSSADHINTLKVTLDHLCRVIVHLWPKLKCFYVLSGASVIRQ